MRMRMILPVLWTAVSVTAAPSKPELQSKIDAYVAPLVAQKVFSGVVLVAKGDEVLVNRAFGNANYEFDVANTPETRFAIASVTKMFTNVILRRLEAEKKLSLSDPLAKYVPDFPSADKITLEHLRTHYSGLRDPDKLRRIIRMNMTTDETVAQLRTEPLGSVPGATYSYTTANYAVLANVIEKVTGMAFADVIQKYVYGPAAMKDSGELTRTTVVPRLATGYMPDPYTDGLSVCGPEDTSWKTAGGSSYSTTADLHRFARAFASGKLTPERAPRDVWSPSKVLEKDAFRASGSFPGAGANLVYFIDDEVTIAITSNNYSPMAGALADALGAIYFDKPYTVLTTPKTLATWPRVDEILGKWSMGTFPPLTISLRGGKPFVSWSPVRVSSLVPIGPDLWFEKFDWLTLRAERDENGRIKGFVGTAPWAAAPMPVKRVD